MKVAAIDVGSNSIHLVVVAADGTGGLTVLAREKAMVRLGRGQATTGAIGEEAFLAGLEALERMAGLVREHACDTLLACGTAALRDAANAPAFVRQAAERGVPIRIISGEEEARLIHLAVSHAVPFPDEPVVLVDIGGGSTELTWVRAGSPEASVSIPWGIQRLADRVRTQDPPTEPDLARLRGEIDGLLADLHPALPRPLPACRLALGTSGTLEDLAKAAAGGTALSLAQLRALNADLWRTPARERPARHGVGAKRAEAIHVGGIWAEHLLAWLGCEDLHHLPVGLREGLVWEALEHGGKALPALAERRWSSVRALARERDPHPDHSHLVERLALGLYEDLRPVFELGDWERDLLRMACALHAIGLPEGPEGHHKRAARLVQQGGLTGFWPTEVDLLAQVVRYHRGRAPDPERHEAFRRLPPWHRRVVEKLAAILRLAAGLTRLPGDLGGDLHLALGSDTLRLTLPSTFRGLARARELLAPKAALLATLLDRPLVLQRAAPEAAP